MNFDTNGTPYLSVLMAVPWPASSIGGAFSPELLIAGRSGCSIGDVLTVDSVFMLIWLDFSMPPRSFKHRFCTAEFFGSGHYSACM